MTFDITGQRFGKLLVVRKELTKARNKKTHWVCQCDCGGTTITTLSDLKSGHTKSCGCNRIQAAKKASTKHGLRHTPLYSHWSDIKNRCHNPKYKRFADWGGRGITVCDEWRTDFMEFYNHVINLPHCGERGYTLDRINNDGNYEPGNVRWATRYEQNMNRRNTLKFYYHGQYLNLIQIEEQYDIKYPTVLRHYHKGDLKEYIERKEVNGA